MGLDRRLREELHEHASSIDPDPHGRLETVMAHPRDRGRWGGVLAGAAAAVLLLAVAGTMLPLGRQDAALTGTTWTVSLGPDDPGVAALGMAGAWTLRLADHATIELGPPAGFSTRRGAATDGSVYIIDGAAMTTTLFSRDYGTECVGAGRYAWSIDGGRLTFTGDDPCDARAVLLTTNPWVATTGTAP